MLATRLLRLLHIVLLAVAVSGCESLGYYSQSAQGQWQLWRQQQDIETLISNPRTDDQLRQQLLLVNALRDFASSQLSLPENNSYRSYADIGRPYVVWNVFAAPTFSIDPKVWCFPIAGCVSYRGYFSKSAAIKYADRLATQGYDTYVGGVSAYSTLGWFNDPVLNTFVDRNEIQLAGLLFHELAHQQFYMPGDTSFNESFATAVELIGIQRWLDSPERLKVVSGWLSPGDSQQLLQSHIQRQSINSGFVVDMLAGRQRLATLYDDVALNDEAKLEGKYKIIDEIKESYKAQLKAYGQERGGYEHWVNDTAEHAILNNAKLTSIANYHQWVPAFQRLYEKEDNNLAIFFERVEALSKLDTETRRKALESLSFESEQKPAQKSVHQPLQAPFNARTLP